MVDCDQVDIEGMEQVTMKLTNNFNNLVNEIREQDIEVIDLMNMQFDPIALIEQANKIGIDETDLRTFGFYSTEQMLKNQCPNTNTFK